MKILFICSKNQWRSPTAEKIFHGVNGIYVRSAGIEKGARIKVTSGHIGWTDAIFVMEQKHMRRLKTQFGQELAGKNLWNLGIPDDYSFMDEELVEILKSRVEEYIDIGE
jgi:predicted protein tyrosine phosphatase